MTEALTAKEREDVEDLPRRQEGCPDPRCGACRANAARREALAKLLRIHDAQGEESDALRAELARMTDLKDAARDIADENAMKVTDVHAREVATKTRVVELEAEIELRQAEHEAANAELRRRIINQAEALVVPRLEDVVEIQALKASAAELKLVISKLVPLIDPMPDDLRAVLVATKVIDAEGGNAPCES